MAVRYWESTMRRSSSRARGSGAAERSMAAPEVQKADQCFSAAAKVAEGSAGVWLARWKPQQKAGRAVAGGSTQRWADTPSVAAGAPGVWLARWKPQQKARRSVAGVSTKRCADTCWMAAAMPGQAMRTV